MLEFELTFNVVETWLNWEMNDDIYHCEGSRRKVPMLVNYNRGVADKAAAAYPTSNLGNSNLRD